MSKPDDTPKRTTVGPCHLCGSGSCKVWMFAKIDADGVVDGAALHAAHGITLAAPEPAKEGSAR